MRPPIFVRPLTDGETRTLEQGLRSSEAATLRRWQIVLASANGQTAPQIARTLGCSDEWVRQVIRAFEAAGLASLVRRSRRPHTIHVAFDAEGAEALRELLRRSPREFGKPTSLWTLALLAEVAAEEGITDAVVSAETIRQTLQRLGVRWQRAKTWLHSPDQAWPCGRWRASPAAWSRAPYHLGSRKRWPVMGCGCRSRPRPGCALSMAARSARDHHPVPGLVC
jgi:transposase